MFKNTILFIIFVVIICLGIISNMMIYNNKTQPDYKNNSEVYWPEE